MSKVLVILVTHNGMRWLERCLGSVTDASVSGERAAAPGGMASVPGKAEAGCKGGLQVDVFVVDNDSTDGSADYIQAHFPQAHLVRSAENLGFTGGNNLGFRYALEKGYDYVYLLNQDAWLEADALVTLVATAEAHPDYAVLSPLQLQADGCTFDGQFAKRYRSATKSARFVAEPAENTTSATKTPQFVAELPSSQRDKAPSGARPGRVFADRQIRKGEKAAGVYEEAAPPVFSVKHIMAAHWLVPVTALREIGLFSELFPYYGQDDEWSNRARYHGYKIGIVPAARAVHDRALRKESRERIIDRNYRVGSLVRLCDVNRPLWERFLFVCLFTIVKAIKYRSLLPFKHFRSICGLLSAIREHRAASL